MAVAPIHQRLAELWMFKQHRALDRSEETELEHCLAVNAKYVWEMAKLENLSLLASMTRDHEWQNNICVKIEQIEHDYKPDFRNKAE